MIFFAILYISRMTTNIMANTINSSRDVRQYRYHNV